MRLEYIVDNHGKIKSVQVQIPIKEWNSSPNDFIILKEKKTINPKLLKRLNNLKESFKEVELIEKGKSHQSITDLLNEL
jgi:hypothetical protein